MSDWLARLTALVFPRKCPVCGTLCADGVNARLCASCADRFRAELSRRCPVCGETAAACRCEPSAFAASMTEVNGVRFVCIGFYDPSSHRDVLSRLVFSLKESTDDAAARIFAGLLSAQLLRCFLAAEEDVRRWTFIYPPRTKEARDRYGFDQAERLARLCARACGASFMKVFRRTGGESQKQLRADERVRNVSDAFSVRNPSRCANRKFILIDDIITTGATAAACAGLLRACGAEAVFAASALRTVPRPPRQKSEGGKPWFSAQ